MRPENGTRGRAEESTLFGELAQSTSYQQFSSVVRQAQGSAGLMRFLQLDLDEALSLDPDASDQAGRRHGSRFMTASKKQWGGNSENHPDH